MRSPTPAIRAAVVNGCVHRDWQNANPTLVEYVGQALVVTSPGGLVGGVRPPNIITHPSQLRDWALAELSCRRRIDPLPLADRRCHAHQRPQLAASPVATYNCGPTDSRVRTPRPDSADGAGGDPEQSPQADRVLVSHLHHLLSRPMRLSPPGRDTAHAQGAGGSALPPPFSTGDVTVGCVASCYARACHKGQGSGASSPEGGLLASPAGGLAAGVARPEGTPALARAGPGHRGGLPSWRC